MTTVLKNILSALFHLPKGEVKSMVDHHTKRSSASPPDSPEEPQKILDLRFGEGFRKFQNGFPFAPLR